MSSSGKKIFHCNDEWGEISVYQDVSRRYLCFGNEVEQSCIDIHTPERLCHNYTQAMMLGFLLMDKPQLCTLLGLGAGSLAQAVLAYQPQCRLIAVEQRVRVVEIARELFLLPESKRLKLYVDDAFNYLNSSPSPSDIILTDLYFADGMNELQAQEDFLAACRSALKPGGILVCNYWLGSGLTAHAMNQTLQAVFDLQVLSITIPDGNCIAYAFDQRIPKLNSKLFVNQAEALGGIMEIPLQRHARTLLRENRMKLRYGC